MDDLIILSLGANLGEREKTISTAIEIIEQDLLKNIVVSKPFYSAAIVLPESPSEWDKEFCNVVITGKLIDKNVTPQMFLHGIKALEKSLGRKPSPKWAPREIDVDILAWGNQIIDLPNLQIPHPLMQERDFVMVPLQEILPNWKNPRK